MGFVDDMEAGRFGVRFAIPQGFTLLEEHAGGATVGDRQRGFVLVLGFFDHRLDLRPAHEPLLRRDIERHARDLFDTCFRNSKHVSEQARPRTDDPRWSPVVEVSHEKLGGARALRVVHRLWYEPGRESIMGHLLAPLERGLFEWRVIPPSLNVTGLREAILFDKARAAGDKDPRERLGQAGYDDPKWDATFPEHPLSVTREALAWLTSEVPIEVLEPAKDARIGEDVVERAGFAITPPPRYLRAWAGEAPDKRATWSRVSFCGTDGVQSLTVSRLNANIGSPDAEKLARLAEKITKESLPEGVSEVHLEAAAKPDEGGRRSAETYRAYVDSGAAQHSVFRWIAEPNGSIVLVSLGASQCVPRDELAADAEAVARSFRLLEVKTKDPAGGPPPKKKWWQVF